LEANNIVTKTETSDWGSSFMVITKADNSVCLCVDYKVGVNERFMDSHYPIQKINEVLNSLRNSRYFCKLDLFKVYLHISVDKHSSKIQISTHRDLIQSIIVQHQDSSAGIQSNYRSNPANCVENKILF